MKKITQSRVELFGSTSDPEVKESLRLIKKTGREVSIARPSFDTGMGPCGRHLCSCKHVCAKNLAGAMISTSF
jgi:hypothetical protein